jgi:RNA 3'-terminal phosphate cyclase
MTKYGVRFGSGERKMYDIKYMHGARNNLLEIENNLEKESVAMLEIREIRDRNSLRHSRMTPDEITKEYDESIKKFIDKMGVEIKITSLSSASR